MNDLKTNEIISERIRTARQSLNISMAEASRRLNLSKIGYYRYEYGDRTPSPQTLEVIARCFNTSVDYLTGKTNDMNPDYIIITKESNPALIEMFSTLKNADEKTIERLRKYYDVLINENK